MDQALDDVVRERHQPRRNGRNGRRSDRGGVRKPGINRKSYNEDRLWVHDKFEDAPTDTYGPSNRGRGGQVSEGKVPLGGAKVKVENIHYELGYDELLGLFKRQGPVFKLELLYDRAGRSEGIAFVTYEHEEDAAGAIREFNGANANGQPISLSFVSRAPAPKEGRSLFDRITSPEATVRPLRRGRARSLDGRDEREDRRDPTRKPTPPGIDRYVPPERRRERERGDRGDRGGPRRSNGGRDRGRNDDRGRGPRGSNRAGAGSGARPKKTAEELDEEMENYFTPTNDAENTVATVQETAPPLDEDEEMIL